MAVSPMKGITKATVTAKSGYSLRRNTVVKYSDGLVAGLIEIQTGALTARSWVTIGTIDFLPHLSSFQTMAVESSTGSYFGMVEITQTGNINLYPVISPSSTAVTANIVVTYL